MYIFRKIASAALVLCVLCVASVASARNPTRIGLHVFGKEAISDRLTLKSKLLVAGLQSGDPFPYVYAGAGYEAVENHLSLDLMGGFMGANDTLISPRVITVFGKLSTFTMVDFYSDKTWYSFTAIDYELSPKLLKAGVTYEPWGAFEAPHYVSHGVGPHLSFFLGGGKYGMDLEVQARRNGVERDVQLEPGVRIHGFL